MDPQKDEKKGAELNAVSQENVSRSIAIFTEKPPKDSESTVEDDDPDILCGLGSWTPKWIQRAATPRLFLLFYALSGLTNGASFTYLIGCISTMEKRFAYDSKRSGLILIAEEIGPIALGAIIGHFGGLSHRPRFVTYGMFLGAFGSFIMALPYFIFGAGRLDEGFQRSVSRISGVNVQFCDKDFNNLEEMCTTSPAISAVSIFFFGSSLKGLSLVIYYTIGTAYVDDGVKKKNSPVYLGTLFALRLLGPTLGFLLSSLCLEFYEDPFYDPGFGTTDPRWVGAWWLGFIILGVFIFISSVPMIFFPKRFPKQEVPQSAQKRKGEERKSPIEQLKDMGKAMKRLIKNPILTSHYLGGVSHLIGIVGYYVLLPKYMEMQFRQSSSKASLYSGPASILGMQLGILIGGIAIRKWRPRPRIVTGAIVFSGSVTVISLISCMFITCPIDQMTGTSTAANPLFNLQNECNMDCKCTTKVYTPVCGPDGKSTYFSPCFAGCTGYNKTEENEIFMDCKCVHGKEGELMVGDSVNGYCGFECQWMITYIVLMSVGKFLSATSSVGNALVVLRCVDPEDKSISLGASTGIYSLLGYLPYPFIYGALTDASCLVWEESCGRTGNCWIYDTDKFRYLLHGVSAAFIFVGCVADTYVCFLSPRLRNLYDDDEDEKDATAEGIAAEVVTNGVVVKTRTRNSSVHSLNENPTLRF